MQFNSSCVGSFIGVNYFKSQVEAVKEYLNSDESKREIENKVIKIIDDSNILPETFDKFQNISTEVDNIVEKLDLIKKPLAQVEADLIDEISGEITETSGEAIKTNEEATEISVEVAGTINNEKPEKKLTDEEIKKEVKSTLIKQVGVKEESNIYEYVKDNLEYIIKNVKFYRECEPYFCDERDHTYNDLENYLANGSYLSCNINDELSILQNTAILQKNIIELNSEISPRIVGMIDGAVYHPKYGHIIVEIKRRVSPKSPISPRPTEFAQIQMYMLMARVNYCLFVVKKGEKISQKLVSFNPQVAMKILQSLLGISNVIEEYKLIADESGDNDDEYLEEKLKKWKLRL